MKKYISIIVPFYNSRDYIEIFLDSINKQTSDNFEVIFIDDLSTDDGCNFLKSWLKNNAKFSYRVIKNKKNSGPGISRNNGIEIAKGDYIVFSDADDALSLDFVEKSCSLIEKDDIDLIIYDYFIVNEKKNNPQRSCLTENYGIISNMDALALSRGMCWGKVFKKSIILEHEIRFPNMIRSEDLVFVKKYISVCKEILYNNSLMYYYYQHNDSIMHSDNTMHVKNNIRAFNEIKRIGENIAVEMVLIREYLYLNTQIMLLKKYKFKEIKDFIRQFSSIYPKWYQNKYIKYQPFYLKVMFILIRFRFLLLLKLIFLLKKKGL